MISALPNDIANMICAFAFNYPWARVATEVPLCIECQENIPPILLRAVLPHVRCGTLLAVPNPLRRFSPYHPLGELRVWLAFDHSVVSFVRLIDQDRIRSLRTYKGVAKRHARRCMTQSITGWNALYTRILSKIDESFFSPHIMHFSAAREFYPDGDISVREAVRILLDQLKDAGEITL